MRKQANALLKALSEHTGMTEEPRLDSDDLAFCVFGDDALTTFSYADELEEMIVGVLLFPLPEKGRGETVAALMRGNYAWGGTDGGVIGLDGDTGLVVLSKRFPIEDETPASFVDKVGRMYRLALHWRGTALPLEKVSVIAGVRA